jgi:hypothetical protein
VERHDEEEPYPLPFHPLDLGERAMLEFFGFYVEGCSGEDDATEPAVDIWDVELRGFRVTPSHKAGSRTDQSSSGGSAGQQVMEQARVGRVGEREPAELSLPEPADGVVLLRLQVRSGALYGWVCVVTAAP